MSHFTFDQQLSDAVRMDSSIHLTNSYRQSLKPSSNLNISGVNLNRSRSASRLSPSLLSHATKPLYRSKSPARRSKTPTRLGSTSGLGNLSNISNQGNGRKSQGGADRFIPNRSTTDMEFAQHSLVTDDDTGSLTVSDLEKRKMMEENLNPGDYSRILEDLARNEGEKEWQNG